METHITIDSKAASWLTLSRRQVLISRRLFLPLEACYDGGGIFAEIFLADGAP